MASSSYTDHHLLPIKHINIYLIVIDLETRTAIKLN
jgi:hypothetical protein